MSGPKDLVDYGVITVKPLRNPPIVKRIRNFIETFKPELVILEDTECALSKRGKRVHRLLAAIEKQATTSGITVRKYPLEQVRTVFEDFGAFNKCEIARLIIKWLPELKAREPKPRRLWMAEDYNMGIFDAIALSLTHFYVKG